MHTHLLRTARIGIRTAPNGLAVSGTRHIAGLHHAAGAARRRLSTPQKVTLAGAAPFSLWSWLTDGSNKPETSATGTGEQSGSLPSRSSAILYPAADAAIRATNEVRLVFLNINLPATASTTGIRSRWTEYIGYFREMGYDCLDVNVVSSQTDPAALAQELHGQVSKQMFMRGPVLFVANGLGADVGGRAMAKEFAAVVLADAGREQEAFKAATDGRAALVVTETDEKKAIRQVEQWLLKNGF